MTNGKLTRCSPSWATSRATVSPAAVSDVGADAPVVVAGSEDPSPSGSACPM